jgi:hypothetical protein
LNDAIGAVADGADLFWKERAAEDEDALDPHNFFRIEDLDLAFAKFPGAGKAPKTEAKLNKTLTGRKRLSNKKMLRLRKQCRRPF